MSCINYTYLFLLSICEIAQADRPNCLAVSAKESPSSSTRLQAEYDHNFDKGRLLLPERSAAGSICSLGQTTRLSCRQRPPLHALPPLELACKTVRLVHTNRLAASRTGPLDFFFLNKTLQSFGLYAPQIINHAHAILRTIALIQTSKTLTREARTVRAEITLVFASCLAILDSACNARLRLSPIITSATWATIPTAQKSVTEAAIHTTWGNERDQTQTSICALFCHRSAPEQGPYDSS
jgi:hypothetical protein